MKEYILFFYKNIIKNNICILLFINHLKQFTSNYFMKK